ncbi:MAG: hypothetical protein HY724_02635 [Candidatus Rokubacteria bacterium]|nr:hypothetical protein [Candidatus Rokubacteria bacterium]
MGTRYPAFDTPFGVLTRLAAGSLALLALLALWAGQGVGDEVAIWREVAVHGQDLAGQLAQPVAEMKQELTSLGCNQFSLAYWWGDLPTQLRVEMRCRGWMSDVPPDSRERMGRASHDSPVAGPPR